MTLRRLSLRIPICLLLLLLLLGTVNGTWDLVPTFEVPVVVDWSCLVGLDLRVLLRLYRLCALDNLLRLVEALADRRTVCLLLLRRLALRTLGALRVSRRRTRRLRRSLCCCSWSSRRVGMRNISSSLLKEIWRRLLRRRSTLTRIWVPLAGLRRIDWGEPAGSASGSGNCFRFGLALLERLIWFIVVVSVSKHKMVVGIYYTT